MSEILRRIQTLVLGGDYLVSEHGFDELENDAILAQGTKEAMTKKQNKLVREGKYAAEIPVELIHDDTAWSPYLSPDDVQKLDAVRLALRRGDIADAAKYGRVFELTPISVK